MKKLTGIWDLARGRSGEDKTEPLRYCILLPDFSGVQSDEKGWQVYTDVEALKTACTISGGIPSTVEAAEQIVKQNAELAETREQAAALQIQLDRAIQQSRFVGNKATQTVKERDDVVRYAERLEKSMQFAFEQLHHSYNDAPDWLEHDTHGWIRRAAIELRDALAK